MKRCHLVIPLLVVLLPSMVMAIDPTNGTCISASEARDIAKEYLKTNKEQRLLGFSSLYVKTWKENNRMLGWIVVASGPSYLKTSSHCPGEKNNWVYGKGTAKVYVNCYGKIVKVKWPYSEYSKCKASKYRYWEERGPGWERWWGPPRWDRDP